MKLPQIDLVFSKGQAQDLAVEWQQWASDKSMSYRELIEYQAYFKRLAIKFDLEEEFKENGII